MYIRHLSKTVLAASMASFCVAGCGDDDEPGTSDPACLSQSDVDCSGSECVVPAGNYDGAISFDDTSKPYSLQGRVFMGGDVDGTACTAQLTIAAGVTIQGAPGQSGYLAILPGSTINANGTESNPILMTSGEASPARGDWGGLIISGNATVNCGGAGVTCNGEGDTGAYGGTNDSDNSGTLNYVKVEYGGNRVNPTDELNGIAFQGVGSGTTVENVHVHLSGDDGVEFFGGTVNAKRVILTGIGDDSMDWTFGWRGMAQFVLVQQHSDDSDNGIEADNNGDDNTATPRSNPIISNITLIGSPESDSSDVGMLLREGTGAQIWNAVVTGFNDAAIDIDNDETFANAQAAAGNLAVAYGMFYNENLRDEAGCAMDPPAPAAGSNCAVNFEDEDGDAFTVTDFVTNGDQFGSVMNTTGEDPGLTQDAFNESAPNFVPAAGGAALTGGMTPSDSFFESVTFRGGADSEWYGWTSF